jgi:signal transduction histidine kinase
MSELGSGAGRIGQLISNIVSELTRARPGSDEGLLPVNCLLTEVEEIAGTKPNSEPFTRALKQARQWVDSTLEMGAFDWPTLQRLQSWAAWLGSASHAVQAGQSVREFQCPELAEIPSVPAATPVAHSVGKKNASSTLPPSELEHDPALLAEFITECEELLNDVEISLERLSPECSSETVDSFFRSLHTLKGSAGTAGFRGIERTAHHLESILDLTRSGAIPLSDELSRLLHCGIDLLRSLVNSLAGATRPNQSIAPEHGKVPARREAASSKDSSVPLELLCRRMQRMALEIARQQGKEVELVFSGAHRSISPRLAKTLREALLHLVRNAVDHGIELPAVRVQKKKSSRGRIVVDFSERRGHLHVTVRDDGAGIHLERVHEKAVERGLIRPGRKLSGRQLRQLIFKPGFSTASAVSEISGRGVGLDAVRHAVVRCGGGIEVRPGRKGGCEFRVRVPCPDKNQMKEGPNGFQPSERANISASPSHQTCC